MNFCEWRVLEDPSKVASRAQLSLHMHAHGVLEYPSKYAPRASAFNAHSYEHLEEDEDEEEECWTEPHRGAQRCGDLAGPLAQRKGEKMNECWVEAMRVKLGWSVKQSQMFIGAATILQTLNTPESDRALREELKGLVMGVRKSGKKITIEIKNREVEKLLSVMMLYDNELRRMSLNEKEMVENAQKEQIEQYFNEGKNGE